MFPWDIYTFIWIAVILLTIWAVLNKKLTTNVEGLEPTPGPLHKVLAALFMVSMSKRRPPPKEANDPKWVEGRHRFTPQDNPFVKEGDNLKGDEYYNDSYYFWGNEKDLSICVSTRIGHFGISGSKVTPWLNFSINGVTYNTPDGFVEGAKPGDGNEISATWEENKLEYKCEEPMKRWRLVYNGKMKNFTTEKLEDCKIDIVLNLYKEAFNYTRHWDEVTTAKAMSAKPWSRDFFTNLKRQHQQRYEQGGKMTGFITMAGKEHPLKDMWAFRDHSYGRRDWTYMIRYIWFGTVCFFKPININGKSYNCLTGTSVEYGDTFKHLVAGGLTGDEGVLPLTGMTHMKDIAPEWFELRNVEKDKSIGYAVPDDLKISLALKSGHILDVSVDRSHWKHGFIMQDGTFDVHEGQCIYTLSLRHPHTLKSVATVQGSGLLEFGGSLLAR